MEYTGLLNLWLLYQIVFFFSLEVLACWTCHSGEQGRVKGLTTAHCSTYWGRPETSILFLFFCLRQTILRLITSPLASAQQKDCSLLGL